MCCVVGGFHRETLGLGRGSLVELLVVLGIIALLISLIIPAVQRARSEARFIQCKSNIRQVLQAHHLYAADNRDAKPPLFLNLAFPRMAWVSPDVKWKNHLVGQGQLADRYLKSLEPLLDPSEAMQEDAAYERRAWSDSNAAMCGSSYAYYWRDGRDLMGGAEGATYIRAHNTKHPAILMDLNLEAGHSWTVGGVVGMAITAHPSKKRVNVGYDDDSVKDFPANELKLKYPGDDEEQLRWFDQAHAGYYR